MPVPAISVVIPCYNGSKYLVETLDSVLAQTHRPAEVLVVDDGSKDESAALAESFGSPVRVIRQANQGESVARNRGIDEAAGEWVAFVDADDLWSPCKLETQLRHAADGTVAVATNLRNFGSNVGDAPKWQDGLYLPGTVEYNCLVISYHPSSLLVSRSCPVRFPVWTKHCEDTIYAMELSLHGPVAMVDEPLTHYRHHARSQSSNAAPAAGYESLLRWIEENRGQLGEARAARLASGMARHIVERAKLARSARNWALHDALTAYALERFPGEQAVLRFRREWSLPRSAYWLADWVRRRLRRGKPAGRI